MYDIMPCLSVTKLSGCSESPAVLFAVVMMRMSADDGEICQSDDGILLFLSGITV